MNNLMRVAFDTNGLYTGQAGVARYTRGLLRGLRALNPPGVEIEELSWPVENFEYRQPQRAWRTFYREVIWAKGLAPRWLKRHRTDLWHCTSNLVVRPPRGIKQVYTLHDLAAIRHPERFRRWQRRAAIHQLHQMKLAEKLICVSQFTADEAMDCLGLPSRQLVVVANGCDFLPEEGPVAERPPETPVPPEYFLYVGSLEPGKNLALIRESYQLSMDRGIPLPPLLLVGVRWAGVANEGAPPAGWHYLGRQSDEVLVYLYRRARGLVFPSKYEGFGLPLVEAMALDCPVICSRVASLPEVGGDAVGYVPLQADAYLEAMRRLAQDAAWRQTLIEKGREQCRRFTWKRCAAQTAQVYQDVLGR